VVAFVCRHYGWSDSYVWNDITFAQLLLYTEEMQSQQRAENGVKEVIIGYYGEESEQPIELPSLQSAVSEFQDSGIGPMFDVSVEDLPDHVREVFLAEMHRMKTGEVRKATEFKIKKEGG
jgi:hypothetical protein